MVGTERTDELRETRTDRQADRQTDRQTDEVQCFMRPPREGHIIPLTNATDYIATIIQPTA